MDNEINLLKKQIKENKIDKLYLFFGEEKFLIDKYIKDITNLVPDMGFPEFNRIVIDGAEASLSDVSDAVDSFPMMSDKKLIIITDTGAFGAKTSAETKEYYTAIFGKITDDTVLIIREENVDKRSTVYKSIKKSGTVVEFKNLSDTDLVAWVIRRAHREDKKITRENAELLVSICEKGLGYLENEIIKLCSYCENEITEPAIKKLASKSLEAKVFDLCDYIMAKDADKALALLSDLKINKESPYAILYLFYSSFEKILKTQLLIKSNMSKRDIVSSLSVPFSVADKYINAAKGFKQSEIISLIISVPEFDLSIKRGEIEQWKAVEKLIFKGIDKRKE